MSTTDQIKTAFQNLRKGVKSLKASISNQPTLRLSFQPESRLKLVPICISTEDDNEKKEEYVPIYSDGQNISGQIHIILPASGAQFEYEDIAVYLVGHVLCPEIDEDAVFLSHKIHLTKGPGIITKNREFAWKFTNPLLKLDSYYGSLFKCRYFVRAIINRPKVFQSNIKIDQDFCVMNVQKLKPQKSVSMQVGVDECLHIQFSYDNINLSTHGCLEGSVTVLSNNLKITTMQIQVIRRETIQAASASLHKPEVINTTILGKFEVMDGLPGDEETIPVRMFLQRFKGVTNTQITDHFSVRFYANLGLIDMDGRRYFKTCELNLFRTHLNQIA